MDSAENSKKTAGPVACQWISQAEYAVAGPNWSNLADYPAVQGLALEQVAVTPLLNPCDLNSYLIIYKIRP